MDGELSSSSVEDGTGDGDGGYGNKKVDKEKDWLARGFRASFLLSGSRFSPGIWIWICVQGSRRGWRGVRTERLGSGRWRHGMAII